MLELNKEQREQFNEILELLGESLDISQSDYDKAVESYKAVGTQLAKDNSGFPSKVVNVDITLPPPKKAVVKLYEPFQLYYRFFGRW
jgi:hypothetical protein